MPTAQGPRCAWLTATRRVDTGVLGSSASTPAARPEHACVDCTVLDVATSPVATPGGRVTVTVPVSQRTTTYAVRPPGAGTRTVPCRVAGANPVAAAR